MRVPSDHPLSRTFGLFDATTATDVAKALVGTSCAVELAGLVDLLHEPPTSSAAIAAITALHTNQSPHILAGVAACLQTQWPSVRAAAIRFFDGCNADPEWAASIRSLLLHCVTLDTSWSVRRDALVVSVKHFGAEPSLHVAATDPHWRVRHAWVQAILQAGTAGDLNNAFAETSVRGQQRIKGLRTYLSYRQMGVTDFEPPTQEPVAWHDPDPAVMARELGRMPRHEAASQMSDEFASLLWHADERVRKVVAKHLLEFGSVENLAIASQLLNDPREWGYEHASSLFGQLSSSRAHQVAKSVLRQTNRAERRSQLIECGQLAWAKRQSGLDFDVVECPAERFRKKLDIADDSQRRADALTLKAAESLVAEPTQETSWRVLRQACRLTKTPFWEITPDAAWSPGKVSAVVPAVPTAAGTGVMSEPASEYAPCPRVSFGPQAIQVSRLGLSGHYRLPPAGFSLALDAGVNFAFWEPNYDTMTKFVRSMRSPKRNEVHFIAGSFGADSKTILLDAERALRQLKLECLTLFQMFWVRSWNRITDEVRATLEKLQKDGKIRMFGLSTHNRSLAIEAIQSGWNPVMVRHSLAHRGAEESIFPAAAAHQTSLITFNNTCYGRLLENVTGPEMEPSQGQASLPNAAECYRYTLSKPEVNCCLTAPSTVDQLRHNLSVFSAETPVGRLKQLKRHGDAVYEHDRVFRMAVRSIP